MFLVRALWNAVLGIFSFFFLGYFPKFLMLVHEETNLTALQIFVSGELWTLDALFWAWAVPLSVFFVGCSAIWKCIEVSCENRRYSHMIDTRAKLDRAKRLDAV